MGFIANLAYGAEGRRATTPAGAAATGAALWQRTFGTSKEEGSRQAVQARDANSYTRSLTSVESVKRLLEALRSRAPGGWTDDRYEQSKHFTGIQYVCIHRSGEQLMQSEFEVFVKDDNATDGKRPVKRYDEAYALNRLLEEPNGEDCFGDLMYSWNQQMDLTGMALTWMVPNALGRPMELYPIPTAIAVPQPSMNVEYPQGFYRIQPLFPYGPFSSFPSPTTAVGAPIPAQWMMRFKYPHPLLRYEGYSPFTALRQYIDGVDMMDRSRTSTMRQAVKPSAVLNMEGMEGGQPLPEEEIARILADFAANHQGPDLLGRLFIAAPGCRLDPWGANAVDMDYFNGWDQLTSFIMAAYGVTKPVAGMIDESSYATLFAAIKQFHLLALNPKCYRIAKRLTRQLARFFGDDLIIEIKCPRIDDHELKNQKINTMLGAMCITKGEVRKEYEYPLFGDERDDEIAGQPSMEDQMKQQQIAMMGAGAPGGDPNGGMPQPPPLDQGEGEGGMPIPPEMMGPSTGDLGKGSLGPRKSYLVPRSTLHYYGYPIPANGQNGHKVKA